MNTGNTFDKQETIPKVEIHKKKINSTTVKFVFKIRVMNEGTIPGYATEIRDHVPEGLKFYAEDNKDWTQEQDGTVVTNALAKTLLNPGESATVDITLRWVNGNDNFNLKTNWAEISEDYNEYDALDIDSTPDNHIQAEDDMDDSAVILSIKTGVAKTYFGITTIVLTILGTGIYFIKRYVLF